MTRDVSDNGPPQYVPPSRALGIMRRRKILIALVAVVLFVPAAAFIWTLRAYYDAQAVVMVNMRKTEFSDLQATVANVTGDTLTMRTQTDILTSPSLAGRVVDKLDLVHNGEVRNDVAGPPSIVSRATHAVLALAGMTAETPELDAAGRRQVAISWLMDRMSIVNDGRSYTISIRARTADPRLSSDIANAYSTIYLDFNKELKVQAVNRANAWLDQEIAPLQARVQRAEEAVEKFREANGLVVGHASDSSIDNRQGDGLTVADQQLQQINTQLVTARGVLAEKQGRLRQIQDALRGGGTLESIPEVVASPLIQRLREQQADLTGKQASYGQFASANHPAMQALQSASVDLQRRIASEVSKIAGALQSEVNAAQANVASLQTSMDRAQAMIVGQSKANVTLQQLLSESSAARAVYRDYLTRYEQTSTQAALQEPEADLISAASPPVTKTGPPRGRLLALTAVASGFIGCLVALLRDRVQSGVRTAEQLEAETGLFPLGFIPVAPQSRRMHLETRVSMYTEAVNQVRSMLRFGDTRHRARVVLVTSASPKEGKTFFSISLAASVGRGEGRALIIDGDLRLPSVLREIRQDRSTNRRASEPFQSFDTARVSISRDVLPGVDLMTFARAEGRSLMPLDPETLRALVSEARDRYDLIIVDTPPVLAVADAPAIASVVDGAIMVVRWRRTPAIAINSALYTLQAYGIRILGGVVTQVEPKELSPSESGHGYLYSTAPKYFAKLPRRHPEVADGTGAQGG